MYKLLLGLGVINLAFQFPNLTALVLTGVFFYDKLTEQDKQELMSIYSNGKEFTKYLITKAKELGLTIKELRKQVIVDLEVPPSEAPNYNEAFTEPEHIVEQPSREFFENLPDLSDYLTYEELDEFSSNPALIEKVAAVVKEGLHQPEAVWQGDNLTLNDFLGEIPEIVANRKDTFEKDFNLELNYTKPMTHKYFRQITSKFKAVGKNNLNEVIDKETHVRALVFLEEMDYFFRYGKRKPFIFD